MLNWKLRFKNKPFVVTFTTLVITFIYQVLALFGFAPNLTEDMVTQLVSIVINILGVYGIVVDPTTPETKDSNLVLSKKVD